MASTSSRRRRRSSTADTAETALRLPGNRAGSESASQEPRTIQSHPPSRGLSPSPKRRRLVNMRPDGISSTNGSTSSPSRKALSPSLNGQTPYASFNSNGEAPTNGHGKPAAEPSSSYHGHDREEVTRILIQSLFELGYNGAASQLGKESGYELESSAVATFRSAVLEGRWTEAEHILVQSFYPDGGRQAGSGKTISKERLLLADGADKSEMLFYLRQQKFLELLEVGDLGSALIVLRHELTPLNFDIGRLHSLSRCVNYSLHRGASGMLTPQIVF